PWLSGQPEEPHPDGHCRRSLTPSLWTHLPRRRPAPFAPRTPLLRGRIPRRHHSAHRGRRHGGRLLPAPDAAHHNHPHGPATGPPPSGRVEAAMRVASRSVWRRLPEGIRRTILEAILIIQQEALRDHLRSHPPRSPCPPGGDLRPPVVPSAGDQPPGGPAAA